MDDLETWLTDSQYQRDALFSHAKSPIPSDKGHLDHDIELSIRVAEAAGAQLAKARYYLTGAMADAFSNVSKTSPDVKGAPREILIKDQVKGIQLLHDEIENLARALNSRVKASCNGRRSLL